MVNLAVRANIFGKMGQHMLDSLYKAKEKAMESGFQALIEGIFMLVIIKKIKNRGKENIFGIMVLLLKDNL